MKRQTIIDNVKLNLDDYVGNGLDSVVDYVSKLRDELKSKYHNITLEVDYGWAEHIQDSYYLSCERLETDIEVAKRKEKLQKSRVRHVKEEEKAKENRYRQYKKLKKEFGEQI